MSKGILIDKLIEQLQTAVGAALQAPVEIGPATISGQAWTLRLTVPDVAPVMLTFDQLGASELVRLITGTDPTDEATRDSLRELCTGAMTATISEITGAPDAALEVEGPDLGDWPRIEGGLTQGFTSAALPVILIVTVSVEGEAPPLEAPVRASAAAPPPVDASERIDVLLDIDLPLVVRFGSTQLPLKTLAQLGPGSLIDLARTPEDPVEMLVGERVIARGEVVVVSGSYGIRIIDVVSRRSAARGAEV